MPLALSLRECQPATMIRRKPRSSSGGWHSLHETARPRERAAPIAPATTRRRARRSIALWAMRLVLRPADAAQAVLEVRRVLDDLGEAHDRDGVVERDLAVVDLLEEVDELLRTAELRVVVLDVARREVLDPLDLHVVDDGVEQLLARRVLIADGDEHDLV